MYFIENDADDDDDGMNSVQSFLIDKKSRKRKQ